MLLPPASEFARPASNYGAHEPVIHKALQLTLCCRLCENDDSLVIITGGIEFHCKFQKMFFQPSHGPFIDYCYEVLRKRLGGVGWDHISMILDEFFPSLCAFVLVSLAADSLDSVYFLKRHVNTGDAWCINPRTEERLCSRGFEYPESLESGGDIDPQTSDFSCREQSDQCPSGMPVEWVNQRLVFILWNPERDCANMHLL